MIDKNNLPPTWTIAKLGDVCEKVEAVKRKEKNPEEGLLYLDIGGIDNSTNKILTHKNYKWKDAPSRAQQIVFIDDVLFSTVRTYMRNIARVENKIFDGQIASSGFAVIRGNKKIVNSKFIFFYALSHQFLQPLNKLQTGSSYPAVRDKDIFTQPIPIAPLPEQHRIVKKIEELFTDLDKGIESLKIAQQQLRVYRQAVMMWTFEVTKKNHKKYLLKDVSEKIQIGPFGTQLHKEDYIKNGIPLINPTHIQDGKILANSSFTITKQKRDSLPNYILEVGDVIMGRRGEMARCGLVSEKEKGWFCGTGSLYVRPKKNLVESIFLYYFLSSHTAKKYLDENAGGTTMANLNLKIVNNMPLYLPSIKEQTKIIHEIQSRLSVCDKIEETLEHSLLQSEALRLSIIKKAFEGKLIKQNPKDEPAQKLLERIRAEIKKNNPEKKVKEVKIKTSKKKVEIA